MALTRAVLGHFDGRIMIEGDDFFIADKGSITSLALILHEFATNASKYGALSGNGFVDLICTREETSFTIRWEERNGPQLCKSNGNSGFGSILIKAAELQLGAQVKHDWKSEGLTITITIPI